MPQRKPIVFISSTVEDLKDFREAVAKTAYRCGFEVIMQEYFTPQGAHRPYEQCMQDVDKCDVLIAIAAHRHGWIPPEQPAPGGKSITRLECERAWGPGKDPVKEVLGFLVDEKSAWPVEHKEQYRLTKAVEDGTLAANPGLLAEVLAAVAALKDFRSWLGGLGYTAAFTGIGELQARTTEALYEWRLRHPEFHLDIEPPPASFEKYLTDLCTECSRVEMRGFRVPGDKTKEAGVYDIEELYTTLMTTGGPLHDREEKTLDRGMRGRVSLDAVLRERAVVIIGDPGSGAAAGPNTG